MSKTHTTAKGTVLPILNLKGKDYLEVKYRLVWFREDHPTWGIETKPVEMSDKHAVFNALVRDDSGRVVASGHKHEDRQGFPDFREKAESGAIGRALALIGYGTQFTDDLDEGERIVDSPVERQRPVPTGGFTRGIGPVQPGPEDGVAHDVGYRIPFGKYVKRSLEEVGVIDLRGYVDYIERKAEKDGKPLTGQVADFVDRASVFIGAWENQEPGAGG